MCLGDDGYPHATPGVVSPTQDESHLRSRCRSSKMCPVCRAEVIHVPRHLRNCHGWTPEEARTVARQLRLQTMQKQKDYHHRRQCPVDGCSVSVKRLSAHLQSHKITPGSLKYKQLLAKARTDSKCHAVGATGMLFDSTNLIAAQTVSQSAQFTSTAAEQQNSGSNLSSSQPAVSSAAAEMSVHIADQSMTSETSVVRDDISELHDTAEHVLMNDDCAALQTHLHRFMTWMTSPDGGMKHTKSAKQHVTQVHAILKTTGEQSLSSLLDNSVLDAFAAYAEKMKYLPATSKSYLNSLRHFYQFVTATSIVTGNDVQQVTRMLERVKHWIAAYRKQCSKHTQQKMNEDLHKLIQPEQVESFRNSECTLAAVKTLGSLAEDSKPLLTQTDYVLVRDFLLTEIALINANRSGVLSNMTVKQFKTAHMVEDQYVVSVDEHKTATSYGPAKVVLSQTLHSWLVLFTDKMRLPLLSINSEVDAMFVTWNGEMMNSGQITKSIQSIWKKAGLGEGISLNIMRKSAVSTIHQKRPEISSQLADLMCHRLSTAQKCYRVVEREKSSVVASKGLRAALTSASSADVSAADEAVPSTSASTTDRLIWNSEKLLALNNNFQSDITAGTVTLQSVRKKLKGIEELSSVSYRQVYDKLRSEIRSKSAERTTVFLPTATDTAAVRVERMLLRHNSATVDNMDTAAEYSENESSESCIPPSSKAKDIFGKEDILQLTKLCSSVIALGPISEIRITNTLSQTSVGIKLLQKFTLFQLRNRVKYERRSE